MPGNHRTFCAVQLSDKTESSSQSLGRENKTMDGVWRSIRCNFFLSAAPPPPWAQLTLHARALPTRGHRTAPPAPLRGGTPADRVSLRGRVPTRDSGPLSRKRPRLPSLQFCRRCRLPGSRSVRGAPTHHPAPLPRPALPVARSPLGPRPHPPGLTRSSLARGPEG